MHKLVFVCALSIVAMLLGPTAGAAEPRRHGGARAPLKPAVAEGTRAPFVPALTRTSLLQLARYDQVVTVVRTRSEGMRFATFSAEPELIEPGAVIFFEIRSVGGAGELTRWRCVARRDVAECLGRPVQLKYLSDDDRLVLTARMRPKALAEAGSSVAQN